MAGAGIALFGALAYCRPRVKGVGQAGSNRERPAGGIVDSNSEQMFALSISLYSSAQQFVVGPPGGLKAFLDVFRENGRAPREIIVQVSALGPDLVDAIEHRDAHNAYGQWDDEFERGADGNSS